MTARTPLHANLDGGLYCYLRLQRTLASRWYNLQPRLQHRSLFLDLQEAIERDRINFAAEELESPIEEVKTCYRSLAQKFNLILTFDDPIDSDR